MTTKDQAIAQLRNPMRIGVYRLMDAVAELLEQPPAPDCRTCWHLHTSDYGDDQYECDSIEACTNGDQYIEAPAMVLWRTE